MSYFSYRDYVSNSELGDFAAFVADRPQLISPDQRAAIYNLGNLVEVIIVPTPALRPHTRSLVLEDGNEIFFDEDTWKKANEMAEVVLKNQILGKYLRSMKSQHAIFKENFRIDYNGQTIFIKAKCKFDGLNKDISMGADIKTTACSNMEAFVRAFYFFNYDRQAAWYMDIGKIDRMFYIGVGKHRNRHTHEYPVFIIAIERGDSMYMSGLQKYSHLAFQYYHTIYNLDFSNLKIEI